jgi:Recombination endonuclease VII
MDEKERDRQRRQTESYRDYQREYQRAYYHRTKDQRTPEQREHRRQYLKDYRRRNRAKLQPKQQATERERLYRLSEAEFRSLMEQQGSECAICTRLLTDPIVDHDHATGKVRGLLCRRCNTGIGMLEDNPDTLMRAADYILRSWFGATSTMSSEL